MAKFGGAQVQGSKWQNRESGETSGGADTLAPNLSETNGNFVIPEATPEIGNCRRTEGGVKVTL